VDYKGIDFNPSNSFVNEPSHEPIFERSSFPPLPNILPNIVNQIDKIWMMKLSH